jgi:hypothetical protein
VLLEIKSRALNKLLKRDPNLNIKFLEAFNRLLVKRLREANENIMVETVFMG